MQMHNMSFEFSAFGPSDTNDSFCEVGASMALAPNIRSGSPEFRDLPGQEIDYRTI